MRRFLADPLRLRRLGLQAVVLGAAAAGVAAALRASLPAGSGRHSATYLLDVLGWLLTVAGAAAEARVGDLLLTVGQGVARRRAIVFAIVGIAAFLGGCAASSVGARTDALVRGLAGGILVAGFGFGLGGLLTLAWYYGGAYAAERIARLNDEEW